MPRIHAVRSSLYQPNVILGVRDSDWKWVALIALTGLVIPVLGEWFVGPVPVAVFTAIGGLGGALGFFNWTRVGRRPRWLEFQLQALAQRPDAWRRRPATRRQARPFCLQEGVTER